MEAVSYKADGMEAAGLAWKEQEARSHLLMNETGGCGGWGGAGLWDAPAPTPTPGKQLGVRDVSLQEGLSQSRTPSEREGA